MKTTEKSIEKNDVKIPQTIERLVPEQFEASPYAFMQKVLELHMKNYDVAKNYVAGKNVLDIACGSGYGSKILCDAGAKSVMAVDISEEAINYAQKKYSAPQLTFQQGDAEKFESEDQFDVIVSFETIEHLKEPLPFLKKLNTLLTSSGYLLLSVPLGETRHFDPYHLHKFMKEDIITLLGKSGFSTDLHHEDLDMAFMSKAEMLKMGRDVESQDQNTKLSTKDFLFGTRGWLIVRDLLFKKGFTMHQYLLATRKADI